MLKFEDLNDFKFPLPDLELKYDQLSKEVFALEVAGIFGRTARFVRQNLNSFKNLSHANSLWYNLARIAVALDPTTRQRYDLTLDWETQKLDNLVLNIHHTTLIVSISEVLLKKKVISQKGSDYLEKLAKLGAIALQAQKES